MSIWLRKIILAQHSTFGSALRLKIRKEPLREKERERGGGMECNVTRAFCVSLSVS